MEPVAQTPGGRVGSVLGTAAAAANGTGRSPSPLARGIVIRAMRAIGEPGRPGRRAARIALAAALALVATPASAPGSPQRVATLEAAHTPAVAGTPAAVDLHMTWTDPGEPGGKPLQMRRLVLQFAPGTKIDTAALPRCRATDLQIRIKGASVCPFATRLGTGTSMAVAAARPFATNIVFINAKRQIIVVVRIGAKVLAVYRDDVRGRTVTVHLALPENLSLLELRVHIPVHVSGTGARRRVYFGTPPTCPPAAAWPVTATSFYIDGSSQQAAAAAPCAPLPTARVAPQAG